MISRCLVSATLRNEVPHLLKFSALMYTLPDYVNREMFEAWRPNLPDPLSPGGKKANVDDSRFMTDMLAGFDFDNALVANGQPAGSDPNRVILPEPFRYSIIRGKEYCAIEKEDLALRTRSLIFRISKGIGDCRISLYEHLNMFAVLTAETLCIRKLNSCDTISEIRLVSPFDITKSHVGLSPSGRFVTINGSINNERLLLVVDNDGEYPSRYLPACIDSCFSKSESYLWTAFEPYLLSRLDLRSGRSITLPLGIPISQPGLPSGLPPFKF